MEELRIRTVAVALRFFFPFCFTRFSITPSREVSGGGEGEVHLVELLCLCAVRSPTCCTQQKKKGRKKEGKKGHLLRVSADGVSYFVVLLSNPILPRVREEAFKRFFFVFI